MAVGNRNRRSSGGAFLSPYEWEIWGPRKIQKIFWGRGAASERLRNTAKRCSENSELCRDEREQTAGVGKRFFGGCRRFFAPSKKWGYNQMKTADFAEPSQSVRDNPSSTIFDGPPPPLRRCSNPAGFFTERSRPFPTVVR